MTTTKKRFVKVTAIGTDNEGEVEWYAIDRTKRAAKELADLMGMPADSRKYTDIYLTEDQYEEIPEWM